MKKKNYERKVKRDSNLGTTDAIWKMMIDIFFMKKEGRKIHYDQVFNRHQVGKFRIDMLNEAIGEMMPTRDDAEAWNEGKWNNMAVFPEIGKAREFADSLEFNEVQIVKLT